MYNQILPTVRELLYQNSTTADEASADESIGNIENNENIENKNYLKKLNEDLQLPTDIFVSFEGNQYKLSEMENQVNFFFFKLVNYVKSRRRI